MPQWCSRNCRRRLAAAVVAVVLGVGALATGDRARAAAIDDWRDEMGILARLGDRYISSYDVMLFIAYDRMQENRPLEPRPGNAEWRQAVSGVFNQIVLLDAAERFQTRMPEIDRIQKLGEELLDRYGDGDQQAFWRRTGIPFVRIREEIRRRFTVGRYVRETVVASVGVTDADIDDYYSRSATAWNQVPLDRLRPQIERLLMVRRIREELERVRDRFLKRVEAEILDPDLSLEDLTRVWLPGSGDSLNSIPSGDSR